MRANLLAEPGPAPRSGIGQGVRTARAGQARLHPCRPTFSRAPDGSAVTIVSITAPAPTARLRPAAVLVPVVAHETMATVLLTLRPHGMRDHSGQIAFPGGKIDPSDASPRAAALREAEEEIGLPRDNVTPIGYLDPYLTGTGFMVVPDGRERKTPVSVEARSTRGGGSLRGAVALPDEPRKPRTSDPGFRRPPKAVLRHAVRTSLDLGGRRRESFASSMTGSTADAARPLRCGRAVSGAVPGLRALSGVAAGTIRSCSTPGHKAPSRLWSSPDWRWRWPAPS